MSPFKESKTVTQPKGQHIVVGELAVASGFGTFEKEQRCGQQPIVGHFVLAVNFTGPALAGKGDDTAQAGFQGIIQEQVVDVITIDMVLLLD